MIVKCPIILTRVEKIEIKEYSLGKYVNVPIDLRVTVRYDAVYQAKVANDN